MFAALLLISLAGLAIHGATRAISRLALRRWRDGAGDRQL
jgi:ABC-type nitrate/sulfonate/bicarbonate transport system permease component